MRDGRLGTLALSILLLFSLFTSIPALAEDSLETAPGAPIIAVLDTGIDPDHQEFTACEAHPLVAWTDIPDGEPDPYDPPTSNGIGHGTAVASVAVGAMLGQAPCNPLAVARVCDTDGCSADAVAQGLLWAIEQGVDVINLSLGTSVPVPALLFDVDAELDAARQAGILVVVSAGNGLLNAGVAPFPSYLSQPSASEHVLVVGAATPGENPAQGMNTDPEVLQVGTSVRVAQAGTVDSYLTLNGTSFAAPTVAAIAAQTQAAWQLHHGEAIEVEDLETLLKWTAEDDPLTPATLEGWGFLDPATTLAQVPGGMPPAPSCPGPGDLAGHLSPWMECLNLVHGTGTDTVRSVW